MILIQKNAIVIIARHNALLRDVNMKISKDVIHSISTTCILQLKINGLQTAIVTLLDSCKKFSKVDRINVVGIPADYTSVINLADSNMMQRLPIVPRRNGKPIPIISGENLRDKLIFGNIDSLKLSLDYYHPDFANVPMLEQHALVRIPLCPPGEFIFLFNFWSKTYNAFSQDDMVNFETLIAPFEFELGNFYKGGESVMPYVQPPSSGYDRLFLCPDLSDVRRLVEKVANYPSTVLILGETGTGKESVADGIRECSKRKHAPFIKINCGSIPETLLESELFGHERGAFTGAIGTRRGFFESVSGGTILLDEIAEMSFEAQTRLLRVLENKTITRIGGNKEIPVDVRVIASTNTKLEEKVKMGVFRKDLFFRLSVFPIYVPPLRARKNDIRVLVKHFVQQKNKEFQINVPENILESDMKKLLDYNWPGNVRELEHVIERSMILWPGSGYLHFYFDEPEKDIFSIDDWPSLATLEKRYIEKVVDHCGGKLSGPGSASEILGIHYTTLHSKLNKQKKG